VGRVPSVVAVEWKEDWPMMGTYAMNGKFLANQSDMPMRIQLEDSGEENYFVADDSFDYVEGEDLALVWQWNHNPIDKAWSLTERKGYLRLNTARCVENLFVAPNTITQRMEGPTCSARVKLELAGMKDGDVAGFAAFNDYSGVLAVERKGSETYLSMSAQNAIFDRSPNHRIANVEIDLREEVKLEQDVVYLRIDG
jgi:beta-xylosidase